VRRDRQREETRQRVYEAALEIFRRDGVAASRIEDISSLAGVSRGSFYFHFPTKDDVLLERVRTSEARIAAALAALDEATPVEEVMRAFAREFTREWEAEPVLWPDCGVVALRHTAVRPAAADVRSVRAVLAERFRRAAAHRELSSAVAPELLSDFFLVNSFGGALAWSSNPNALPLEGVLAGVAQLFLDGARRRR
jgi:AcrR family transcriptional regulator